MFVEEEAASGPEGSTYLPYHGVEVFDHAEGEGSDDAVEGVVGEGQAFAYCGYNGGVGAAFLRRSDKSPGHVWVGLDGYEPDAGRIEGYVGAGSATDFEGSAKAEAGGQPAIRDDTGLDAGVEKVVPGGEEALAEFVVFHEG